MVRMFYFYLWCVFYADIDGPVKRKGANRIRFSIRQSRKLSVILQGSAVMLEKRRGSYPERRSVSGSRGSIRTNPTPKDIEMMDITDSTRKETWRRVERLIDRGTGLVQVAANFVGAGICTSYFMFFDTTRPSEQIGRVFKVTAVMFIGLVLIGTIVQLRRERSLKRFVKMKAEGRSIPPELTHDARRKILDLPFYCSLVSFMNWCLAAVIMSAYTLFDQMSEPNFEWVQTLPETFRIVIGVLVSGIITGAIVFFAVEIMCQRIWPLFFPKGGLSNFRTVFRFTLRRRLLFVFVLISILPLIIMAVLSYNKAKLMLVMDPNETILSLFYLTLYILLAAIGLSLTLSQLLSSSIVNPVKSMEEAMKKVKGGDLDTSVTVTSADELGGLADHFNTMIEGLRDRERIKETFGRFVTPEIAQAILNNPPKPGGEATEVTILFSDIRNYSGICEQMSSGEVIELLNNYFSYMVRAVERHKGLVYQFAGDGIMAVFGAPVAYPDHARCAVLSAVGMMKELREFNIRHRQGLSPIRMGVGINTGTVVAGIIGTEKRMEYQVIGDAVNVASRLESLNKELHTEILISSSTCEQLGGGFELTEFPPVKVKGKEQPVRVYGVTRGR